MATHLFTYGSLMFNQVWERVAHPGYRHAPATLQGYVRRTVKGASYPGIVTSVTDSVRGVVYFDVSGEDVAALDRFEGAEYMRRVVDVTLDGGEAVQAQTYVYLLPGKLGEARWDPDEFDVAQFLGIES